MITPDTAFVRQIMGMPISVHLRGARSPEAAQTAVAAVFAELEKNRRQLKRSETFLRAAFEAAPIGKTMLDGERTIVRSNTAFARLVGRENVLAGSDCGYGTWVGQAAVDPDVVWAKFAAMAESLGGYGERVTTRRQLQDALEQAVSRRGRFSLIEVMLPRGVTSTTLTRFVSGFKAARAAGA